VDVRFKPCQHVGPLARFRKNIGISENLVFACLVCNNFAVEMGKGERLKASGIQIKVNTRTLGTVEIHA